MHVRSLALFGILVSVALVLGAHAPGAGAQGGPLPVTPPAPSQGPIVETQSSLFLGSEIVRQRWTYAGAQADAAPLALALGEPGLSFRFLKTFGVTEQAYPSDAAHLNNPNGLFIDAGDNLFVTEFRGARVLKFGPAGTGLLTIGKAGYVSAGDHTFSAPTSVAVDDDGRIWVVDQWPDRVAYFDSNGTFQGEIGVRWESGTENDRLNEPLDAGFDATGRLFIADTQNQRVQIFDIVAGSPVYSETIGESGVAGADDAHFNYPTQVAFDSSDRLYVLDRANFRVQRCEFTSGWTCSTFFGVTAVPGSDLSHLAVAFGLVIDGDDNLFVGDSGNQRVLKCDPGGSCALLAGVTGETGSDNDHFFFPTDIALDSSGNVFVADSDNFRVQKFNGAGDYLSTLGMTLVPYAVDTQRYNTPFGIAVAGDGSIYLAEELGYRLVKLDADGNQLWTVGEAGVWGNDDDHFGEFWGGPQGNLGQDSLGRIYITDTPNNRVQIFNSAGNLVGTHGAYGAGNYGFNCPAGVAISPVNDQIYVVDQCNQRVQVYDSNRIYQDTIGVTGVVGDDNGHFQWPRGVAVDSAGFVYVVDTDNHRVQVFDSDHNYSRTMGVSGECGDDFAHLCYPYGVAVDEQRRLYVASGWSNHRVQVFDSSEGYLTTIGGQWGASSGEMRYPVGVAIDQDGNVYVTEYQNHRIQKYAPGYPGWIQANINGFGDRRQALPSLEVFEGQLYAGTWNAGSGSAQVWRTADGTSWAEHPPGWTDDNKVVFDFHTYGGDLYAATANEVGGGEVWRTDGSAWEQVVGGGFGDANNVVVNGLIDFDGALYAATMNEATGSELWRSATANSGDWTQVNSDGFGSAGTAQDHSLEVFNGRLYVGLSRNGVAELWRSADGTSWDSVFTNGLGNSNNTHVSAMEVYGDELFIGLRNVDGGGQVWRSSNGSAWSLVFNGGLGDPNNGRPYGLIAHGSSLYLVFSNVETGAEVWRTSNGTDWAQVVDAGWGDSKNWVADYFDKGAAVFGGSLYVSADNVANGAQIWAELSEGFQIYLPIVTNNHSISD